MSAEPRGRSARLGRRRYRRVFLHVGAPKTGTTYLQGILWRNRHAAAQGRSPRRRATAGVTTTGPATTSVAWSTTPTTRGPNWTGTWDVLADLAVKSEAPNTIISDEHLAVAVTVSRSKRAVESLAPREVHVIYTDAQPRPAAAVGVPGVRQAPLPADLPRSGSPRCSGHGRRVLVAGSGSCTTRSTSCDAGRPACPPSGSI